MVKLISKNQAAKLLGVNYITFCKYVKRGKIPAPTHPCSTYLFYTLAEVDDLRKYFDPPEGSVTLRTWAEREKVARADVRRWVYQLGLGQVFRGKRWLDTGDQALLWLKKDQINDPM